MDSCEPQQVCLISHRSLPDPHPHPHPHCEGDLIDFEADVVAGCSGGDPASNPADSTLSADSDSGGDSEHWLPSLDNNSQACPQVALAVPFFSTAAFLSLLSPSFMSFQLCCQSMFHFCLNLIIF